MMNRKRIGTMLVILSLTAIAAWAALDGPEGTWTGERARVVAIDDDGDTDAHGWVIDEAHGWLGVMLRDAPDGGAVVMDVLDGSPAMQAGLQDGDVITRVDGTAIGRPADLTRAIRDRKAGDEVELEVLRDGSSRTMRVELGDSPHTFSFSFRGDGPFEGFVFDGDAIHEEMERLHERLGDLDLDIDVPGFAFRLGDFGRPLLGVQVIQPTPELREHLGGSRGAGILVGKVHPDSPAADAGVRVGDLLVSVDGNEVGDAGDLSRGLRKARGAYVDLGIVRDGSAMTLRAFIPEPEEPSRRFAPSEPLRAPLLEAPTLQRS